MKLTRVLALAFFSLSLSTVAHAQQDPARPAPGSSTATAPAATAPAPVDEDDDAVLDPAEPDFTVINLPTTYVLPRNKSHFRITHRFAGNLRAGTFGEKAGNLFGIDQGAIIGIEYRFAPIRHVAITFHRSSFDKTIMFYGKYDAIRQRGAMPVAISALVSIEGANNFKNKYAPAVGLVISRRIAGRIAAYATPIWVGNSAASLTEIGHDHGPSTTPEPEPQNNGPRQDTFYLGLGTRIRAFGTTYLVGEITPRLHGYAPDLQEYGFGIEKRVGGHTFSLTFTNTFGTTLAQLTRGGTANALYLGFNLGRKFY
ncbi:MAG: DUF5777 family beta-barrel protein [Acidobacteriota bacterium]